MISVCIDNMSDNVLLLDSSKYYIHNAPFVYVMNGKIYKNYDVRIFSNGDRGRYESLLELDKDIINLSRDFKSDQMRYVSNSCSSLEVPNWLSIEQQQIGEPNNCNLISELVLRMCDFEEDAYVIIKANNGARGLGQVKLQAKDVYRFVKEYIQPKKSIPHVGDYFTCGGIKEDHDELSTYLHEDSWFVTKCVDVKNEYRLVSIDTEKGFVHLLNKRTPGILNGFQANGYGDTIQDISDVLPNAIISDIEKFVTSNDYPFMSVDFYEKQNGKFGMFEYCTQLGYVHFNAEHMRRYINNSLEKKINEKLSD